MPKNDAPRPKRPLPNNVSPAVAQAVLEDAMLEAAADIAALSATLGVASPGDEGVPAGPLLVPETPEEAELLELLDIPLLGPARCQLLADAGISTLADLQAVSSDTLGGIKGVGMSNAQRIKGWLAAQPTPSSPSEAAPSVPAAAPPSPQTVSDNVPDMSLASANQEIQDLFRRLDEATTRLKALLAPGGDFKRLERQLEKLDDAASELAEGPDTLSAKQLQKALKALDSATTLLELAAEKGRLSAKKRDILTDTLKERRKALEKALGG